MELNLGNNKLQSIPKEIGRLTRLSKLNLSDNLLTDLPTSLSLCVGLAKIGAVQLDRNKITNEELLHRNKIGADHLIYYLSKRAISEQVIISPLPPLKPRKYVELPTQTATTESNDSKNKPGSKMITRALSPPPQLARSHANAINNKQPIKNPPTLSASTSSVNKLYQSTVTSPQVVPPSKPESDAGTLNPTSKFAPINESKSASSINKMYQTSVASPLIPPNKPDFHPVIDDRVTILQNAANALIKLYLRPQFELIRSFLEQASAVEQLKPLASYFRDLQPNLEKINQIKQRANTKRS